MRAKINFKTVSNNSGGYIALVSVIIISFLLITITAALSGANYFSRFNILENEFKNHSENLAEACVSYARAKLMADPANYAGNEFSVFVGGDTCSVISVAPVGAVWPKTIKPQKGFILRWPRRVIPIWRLC